MRRRDFVGLLGGLTATCPLRVLAQQGERIRHIAIMMGLAENDTETEARLVKFKNEMEKLGWSEGRNLRIQIRYAPAGAQATEVAKELIGSHPEVILAHSAQVAGALFGKLARSRSYLSTFPIRSAQALLSAWPSQAEISQAYSITKSVFSANG